MPAVVYLALRTACQPPSYQALLRIAPVALKGIVLAVQSESLKVFA